MYYNEITLLPSHEIDKNFLLSKVFNSIHLILVELKNEDDLVPIGISFPEYSLSPGSFGCKLRLMSNDEKLLKDVNFPSRLMKFNDYIHITRIRQIPENCDYAIFTRRQVKSNINRLARRRAIREGLTIEDAIKKYDKMVEKALNLPFIKVNSSSSKQKFYIFIEKTPSEMMVPGKFNTYGLSQNTTVPIF